MKVADLSGALLDKWVANAHGMMLYHEDWQPSREWAQGGPILEAAKIATDANNIWGIWVAWIGTDEEDPGYVECQGKTLLEAAMRCYVESRLGPEVDDEGF